MSRLLEMDASDCNKMENRFKSSRYLFYQDRLATYQCWPKQMRQDKSSLAASGLFYTGEGDVVECFSCGVRLSQWDLYDDVFFEHKKWSNNCLFLKMIGDLQTVENPPLDTIKQKQHCFQGIELPW